MFPSAQVAVAHCTELGHIALRSSEEDCPTGTASSSAAEGGHVAGGAAEAGPSSSAVPQTLPGTPVTRQGTLARESASLGSQWHLAWMTGTLHPGTLARMRELVILQENAVGGRRQAAAEPVPFYSADVPKEDDELGARKA